MDLDRLARPLETDDGREDRPRRGRCGLDARVFADRVLDVLGIDLEAVGEGDHVLLPTVQPEKAVVVELAEVAGVVPATRQRRLRRLVVLPVALEDVRPAGQHLAVLARPDLDAGKRNADRAKAIATKAIEGQRGRALGHAVALQDVDTHVAPGFAKRGVERGRTRDDVAEATAEARVHATEEEPSQEDRQAPRDPSRLLERLLLALSLRAPLDGQQDGPDHRGRDEHHRDAELLHRSQHDRGLTARRVDDGRA